MFRLAVVALAAAFVAASFGFGMIANYAWEEAEFIFFSVVVFTVRSLLGSNRTLGGPSN